MDQCDVIIVDDSPSSSPNPGNVSKIVTDNTMDYIDLSNKSDFCSPNETMAWSQFTTKFISSTMNSVVSNNGRFVTDTRCQTNQNACYNGANTTPNNNIAHRQNARSNLNRQYYSPFSYCNQNCQIPSYGYYANRSHQQNYMHNNIDLMDDYYPEYKNNTACPTPRTPIVNGNYCYFNGHLQMPLRLSQNVKSDSSKCPDNVFTEVTFNKENIDEQTVAQSEYVDVNTLLIDYGTNVNLSSNVLLNSNNTKTKLQPTLPTSTGDNRKTIHPGDSLLKENIVMHMNTAIMTEDNNVALNLCKNEGMSTSSADDSDDSDVIFIGVYKNDTKVPEIVPTSNVTEHDNKTIQVEIKLELKNPDTCVKTETITDNVEKKVSPSPRRNPRRQVQFAKSIKSANEVTFTPKTKSKVNKKPKKKNAPVEKNLRRSLRQLSHCGAVYCPPSPITSKHFRDWPVDGMHERPEYNPVTKKIEPFDAHIRNISKKNKTSLTVYHSASDDQVKEEEEDTLAQLCHEMLHHVLAYVVTVKAVADQENDMNKLQETDNSTKTKFMTNLALNKHNSFDERVCKVFKDTVINSINSKRRATDSEMVDLRDLIENSILLYCLTNNVTKTKVAKYIASIKPDDIVRFSNEKFELPGDISH